MVVSVGKHGILLVVAVLTAALMVGSATQTAWAADSSSAAGGITLQSAKSKVYPSKDAAVDAVVTKVKAKWKKSKPKVKVENAAKKKNMTAAQKKAYKAAKKRAGKQAKKYKFYMVTFTAPRFTICAKYKDKNGKAKKYSLTASGDGGWSRITDAPGYGKKYQFLDEGELSSGKSWVLYSVKKGKGKLRFKAQADEEHIMLTGVQVKHDPSGDLHALGSAQASFTLSR